MSQSPTPSGRLDAGYARARELRAVALAATVTGLVLVVHDPDLRTLGVLDHLGGDRDARELLRIRGDGVAVDQEQRREGQRLAGPGAHPVELELIADGDLLL